MSASKVLVRDNYKEENKRQEKPILLWTKESPVIVPHPRLLMVDDDPIFRTALVKLANHFSVGVRAVDSFQDFEQVHHWNFDAVVMDYELADINGVVFAKYLQETIGNVPVLLVSYAARRPDAHEVWPTNIKKFTQKEQGIVTIFDDALMLLANPRHPLADRYS